jgi:hypothetical protein
MTPHIFTREHLGEHDYVIRIPERIRLLDGQEIPDEEISYYLSSSNDAIVAIEPLSEGDPRRGRIAILQIPAEPEDRLITIELVMTARGEIIFAECFGIILTALPSHLIEEILSPVSFEIARS